MRRRRLAPPAIVALVCAMLTLGGCQGLPTGPSLANITLTGVTLQSTIGNPNLCCCRIVGTATNMNTVPVHVSLQFQAFDGVNPNEISSIFYFIEDLEPGASSAINAAGFVFPCSTIKQLQTEVHVSGIAFPPQ